MAPVDTAHRRPVVVIAVAVAVVTLAVTLVVVVRGLGSAASCDAAFVRVHMTGVERSTNLQLLDAELALGETITDDGQSTDPAFSPDGRRLAYVSGAGYEHTSEHGNLQQSVYVMDLSSRGVRRLTEDHQDAVPTWSPDGTRIAVIRRLPSAYERQIVVIDVATGEERVLGAGPEWREVAWRSDDVVVVTSWRDDGSADLLAIRLDDGAVSRIGVLPGQAAVWNPDRTAAAVGLSEDVAVGEIAASYVVVFDVASGQVREVPDSSTRLAVPLIWTADDVLLFTRNVRGEGFDIMASAGGTGPPTTLSPGWSKPYDAPVTHNPACPTASG